MLSLFFLMFPDFDFLTFIEEELIYNVVLVPGV